ncbi:hypothetical protein HHI36_014256 [Cryptolaemus montrouzieri]|uniref:Uncharacterized protein n=1 Tax=Cryptolaemus montrouzieri TaxID=559131 RepID=A0ABD2N252_9CUCU
MADALSRLPNENLSVSKFTEDVDYPYCNFLSKSEEVKMNLENVKVETRKDKILCRIKEYIEKGWPEYTKNKLCYQYEMEYVRSKENIADALSTNENLSVSKFTEDVDYPYCNFLSKSEEVKMNLKNVKVETRKDKILCRIKEYIEKGWPEYTKNSEIKP